MISLFVDINQYGVKVSRLQIVRALKREDKLLNDVYNLVADRQKRQQAVFAKRKHTSYVKVLKQLQVISAIAEANEQAERMWERLFELALFVRSEGKHRKPSEILKSFIRTPTIVQPKLSSTERKMLNRVFDFLAEAYKSDLGKTRLATDQTHFYTMTTSLLVSDLLDKYSPDQLADLLTEFAISIEGSGFQPKEFEQEMKKYRELSAKQTSDSSRRQERQTTFLKALGILAESKA